MEVAWNYKFYEYFDEGTASPNRGSTFQKPDLILRKVDIKLKIIEIETLLAALPQIAGKFIAITS